MSGPMIHKSAPTVLAADVALTDSLVATDDVDTSLASYVTFAIDYTKGGTALEVVFEEQLQGDATWRPATAQSSGSPSGGAVSVELVSVTHTVTATGSRSITLPCYGATKMRARVRETGTPSGTVTVTAVASRVGG